MIGEAPGESENIIGQPFVGPAGRKLDEIIEEAWSRLDIGGKVPTYALTNLCACFPKEAKDAKINEPTKQEILACRPRLEEFIALCRPRLVVAVGKLAEAYMPEEGYILAAGATVVSIVHPAAIVRMPVAQQGMAVNKAVVTLVTAIESIQWEIAV
jgi:DNA polymerase